MARALRGQAAQRGAARRGGEGAQRADLPGERLVGPPVGSREGGELVLALSLGFSRTHALMNASVDTVGAIIR